MPKLRTILLCLLLFPLACGKPEVVEPVIETGVWLLEAEGHKRPWFLDIRTDSVGTLFYVRCYWFEFRLKNTEESKAWKVTIRNKDLPLFYMKFDGKLLEWDYDDPQSPLRVKLELKFPGKEVVEGLVRVEDQNGGVKASTLIRFRGTPTVVGGSSSQEAKDFCTLCYQDSLCSAPIP